MRAGLVLIALGIALFVAPAESEPGRPRAAEAYAERVVGAGLLEVPPSVPSSAELHSLVHGGRRRARVGVLDVAVALPGALLSRALSQDALRPAVRAIGGIFVSIIAFITIGGVFFARLYRKSGLDLGPGASLLATFALLFSTALLVGVRRADATVGAALVLLLLIDQLGAPQKPAPTPPRHFLQIGILGGALILALPAYAACAIALALLDVFRRRRAGSPIVGRALLAMVPLFGAMVAVRAWDQMVALPPEPSGASVHALFGLLLSPGRSVFVYSPLVLLGVFGLPRLWGRDRPRAIAIAIASITAVLAIAGRADWSGEPSFGPTLLVPLVPLLVEPAALFFEAGSRGRLAFATAAILGVCIQVLGLGVRVEAWPRLMLDVRASTGAPAWFLDPPADIEFVPQLSPVAGHALLFSMEMGRVLPPPPFSLVVASDQAEVVKSQQLETIWPQVWARFDKNLLHPNLACADKLLAISTRLCAIAFGFTFFGLLVLARAYARARREKWRRG